MNDTPLVSINQLGLAYRLPGGLPWKRAQYWAIEDISFEINKGDTIGIIGRNGAGKSSLLRLISGIILPDRGTILRANTIRATMLSFGAGFESRLTGRQNIILNGLQLGMTKEHIQAKTDQIIELADIAEFIDLPIRTYSTGMRARLGFAIAYFVDTDILLIDEALATGDEAFRVKATNLIQEKISSDLTVIIVSHAMSIIRDVCTRAIQIEHGRSLPELSIPDTLKRYSDTFHQ